MRQLATIRKIDAIRPIPDADAIECAVVGGWTVVIKKGDFAVGDLAVYCEIDSWIPTALAPFLSKGKEPREFDGIKGERLRTVRLRGQLSQGLLLLITADIREGWTHTFNLEYDGDRSLKVGDDVTELLGIVKYDPPIPANMAGEMKGYFPSFIPTTDQERIQNLTTELADWQTQDLTWEESEKLEGSSMTVYVRDDDEGVCSRNIDLKRNEDNTLWHVAIRERLIEKIRSTGHNLALQGEIIGEGIQGNIYKIKGQQFYLYDIYDINKGEYLRPEQRMAIASIIGVKHVPVLRSASSLKGVSMGDLLLQADAKSVLGDIAGPLREGVVYKCNEMPVSFKVISNEYLLKYGR